MIHFTLTLLFRALDHRPSVPCGKLLFLERPVALELDVWALEGSDRRPERIVRHDERCSRMVGAQRRDIGIWRDDLPGAQGFVPSDNCSLPTLQSSRT